LDRSREKVDEVRDRTNIVEVVKRHVELKRAGTANWRGLCPFHAEKTPSFYVHESRQFFHCFGCGEKGDVLSFVMKIEQCPFPEALRSLARDAGVDLPERPQSAAERRAREEEESERELMLRAVEGAVAFFEAQLQTQAGAAARTYISSRGISDEVAGRFRVGYAPGGWGALEKHLQSLKIPTAIAETLGLLGVNDRGRYDFFRDRIMLPVIDRQKRAVGFSSRLLDPEAKDRKYVNSPDSPLFHKKKELYGMAAAADAIRRSREAIVVEGNFDVMALHEAGIDNAVAPMGTALTPEQIGMLGRMADRVVVVFDGDDAGVRAARKAVPLFVEADVDGRVARMPRGLDPDEFVRKEGADAFRRLTVNGKPAVEHFIDDLARGAEATIPGRMSALEEAAPILARVRNVTARELYGSRLASALGLSAPQVVRAIRAAAAAASARPSGGASGAAAVTARSGQPAPANDGAISAAALGAAAGKATLGNPSATAMPRRQPARDELEAVVLIAVHPLLARSADARRIEELLTDPGLRPLCRVALDSLQKSDRLEIATWLDAGPEDLREAVSSAVMDGRFDQVPDPGRVLRSLVVRLERGRLEREIKENYNALERARQSGDEDAVSAISTRQVELFRIKQGLGEAPQRP
jgi:DNA primase